ncbi:SLIT-ROBO Rho GTPase-activating protein 1-like [Morone saxatilis]|uniref:SLIT-ROBO Rho GTPase-activating protein 1-like n=1 Tax=Morone saxatilis TaxID=34816 RepID=UPI0015E1BE45|nr:SLIT-ROBO Rho GTPase-activating protein 1-like [Morone saxatilis]
MAATENFPVGKRPIFSVNLLQEFRQSSTPLGADSPFRQLQQSNREAEWSYDGSQGHRLVRCHNDAHMSAVIERLIWSAEGAELRRRIPLDGTHGFPNAGPELITVAKGPYTGVVKLQTMRCLFEAYEHVLSLLERVFTPMFCHSDETRKWHRSFQLIFLFDSQMKDVRAQLVEQQRCLEQQTEMRVQLLQDLQDFFRKKAEIETEYSRNLEKLAERFMAKTRSTKDHQQYKKDQNLLSPVNCWYLLLNQVRRESKDHATISDLYLNNVISRLTHISEDSARLLKRSKEIIFQLQEDLMKLLNELYTVMKTYHMYHVETISAETKLREAERQEGRVKGVSGTGGGVEPVFGLRIEERHQRRNAARKMEKMREKRKAKYSENKLKTLKARNEYLLTLEATNASVFKYYIHDLPDIIDCCDLGYHSSLSRALRTYLSAELSLEASRRAGLEVLEGAVEGLDPARDRQRLLGLYPTAFCPPQRFGFQAHMGDAVTQIASQPQVQAELNLRLTQLQTRLASLKIENEEVKKTWGATLTTLQDMTVLDDYDVSQSFTHSPSSESVKSSVSDGYLNKPSLAKRRANQQETELFYFNKFREYLEGSNLISKLQAKHDILKKALAEGYKSELLTTSRGRKNSHSKHQDSTKAIPLLVESCIRFINLHVSSLVPSLSQYSDENMMDAGNLAIVFGPTLLPTPDTLDQVACQAHVNEVIKTVILNHDNIFPDTKELPGPVYEKCMTGDQYW